MSNELPLTDFELTSTDLEDFNSGKYSFDH